MQQLREWWWRLARDPEVRLAACWVLGVALWSRHVAPAGYLLSFDDVWRLVHAHEASHGSISPSEVWPPLPFWVLGLLLHLWPDATWTARMVGLLIGAATLVQLGKLAGEMGMGRLGRWATMAALGLSPAMLWLAPSALVEPWTLLTGVVSLRAARRWWVDDDDSCFPLAFGALTVGTMLRYEAWGWTAILVAVCASGARMGHPARSWARSALGAGIFPVLWCGWQLAETGNPFNFGAFALEFHREDHPGMGAFALLGEAGDALGELAWPTLLAGATGLVLAGPLRGLAFVISAVILATALQMSAHAAGFAGLHNVWRHYLPAGALLALGCGALVDRVARLGRGLAAAVLALLVQVELLALDWPPGAYEDDVGRVAQRLHSLHDRLGGTVLIEGVGYDSRVLQILLGDMDDASFDRLIWLIPLDRPMTAAEKAENRSLFERPFGEVEARLDKQKVRLIAVYTDEARARAAAFGTVVYAEPERRVGETSEPPLTEEEAIDRGFSREEGRWVILRRGRE